MLFVEADETAEPHGIRLKKDRLVKDTVRANRRITSPKIEEKPCNRQKQNASNKY